MRSDGSAVAAAPQVASTLADAGTRHTSAEEPVTARIRRRVETADTSDSSQDVANQPEITNQERLAQARQQHECLEPTP
jgi:hypothetical protein